MNVEDTEREDEAIDRAKHDQRSRYRAGRQDWRHRVSGPQGAIYRPGLTPDFRRVPAGQDGDEGQRKAQKDEP